MTKSEIDRFVGSKAAWIEKHLEIIRQNPVTDLTDEQIDALKRKAAQILPAKTSHYAGIMGLKPSSVKITSAKAARQLQRKTGFAILTGLCSTPTRQLTMWSCTSLRI